MMLDAEALAPVIKAAIGAALASPAADAVYAEASAEMRVGAANMAGGDPMLKMIFEHMFSQPQLAQAIDALPRHMTERLLERDDFVRLVAERVSAAMRASLT